MHSQKRNVNKKILEVKYKYIPRIADVESLQLDDRIVVKKQPKLRVLYR